jgi:hypothetical protein
MSGASEERHTTPAGTLRVDVAEFTDGTHGVVWSYIPDDGQPVTVAFSQSEARTVVTAITDVLGILSVH